MAVGDAHVIPGFLTPVLTQLFFPKPPTTFLTCFSRGERQKYAGKKVRLNQVSNSQPPAHESDTLTTEPPRRGSGELTTQGKKAFEKKSGKRIKCLKPAFSKPFSHDVLNSFILKNPSLVTKQSRLLTTQGRKAFENNVG